MSYMRVLCPYEYIDGDSDGDYVFGGGGKEGIEDYGKMKTETALDILFKQFSFIKDKDADKDILIHCVKRICENLNIKVRNNPLTDEEWEKLHDEIHEKYSNEHDALHVEGDKDE